MTQTSYSVTIDNKKYTFDSSAMTFLQAEALEKELIGADYQTIISELVGKTLDKAVDTTDLSSEEAEAAVAKANAESMRNFSSILSRIHAALVKTGARERMIAHMLVPEGAFYTRNTYNVVLQNVVPRLTMDQATEVLSCFFGSGALFKNALPKYLVTGATGQSSSTEQTTTEISSDN